MLLYKKGRLCDCKDIRLLSIPTRASYQYYQQFTGCMALLPCWNKPHRINPGNLLHEGSELFMSGVQLK